GQNREYIGFIGAFPAQHFENPGLWQRFGMDPVNQFKRNLITRSGSLNIIGKDEKVDVRRFLIRFYQVIIFALFFKRSYKQAAPTLQNFNNFTFAPLASS